MERTVDFGNPNVVIQRFVSRREFIGNVFAEEVFSLPEPYVYIRQAESEVNFRRVDHVAVLVVDGRVERNRQEQRIVYVVEFQLDVAEFCEFESEQSLQECVYYRGSKSYTYRAFTESKTFYDVAPVHIVYKGVEGRRVA